MTKFKIAAYTNDQWGRLFRSLFVWAFLFVSGQRPTGTIRTHPSENLGVVSVTSQVPESTSSNAILRRRLN